MVGIALRVDYPSSISSATKHTFDNSSSTFFSSCEKLVVDDAKSASALASQDSDISSLEELVDKATWNPTCTVPHSTTDCSPSSSLSLGSPIFVRKPSNWYQTYFISMDRSGCFHSFPHVGGPFQSLQEADDAINHHVCTAPQQRPMFGQHELSPVDWLVQQNLYYRDGTPRRGPNSPARKNTDNELHHLVKALLHQYNYRHNLSKDVAHELKDLRYFQWIFEQPTSYYHFNFTTKTEKAGAGYLFFAEVSRTKIARDWVVRCCCIIESFDNGLCYGCKKNGSSKMKHPNNPRAYAGGHVNGYLPLGGDAISDSEDEDEETIKENLRIMFEEYLTFGSTVGSAVVDHAMSSHIC
ncbi:hypothetical protein EJB05_46402 [Eragrostis curvula]|uniref:DUF3615 domain-containing protein n=1 Tax=Eragrostis curvula TaxID=38414 RepID=A0A5J9TMW2_9POAL|nr:hypothetical protein EJB05_46402 [Eragrostis curvula]